MCARTRAVNTDHSSNDAADGMDAVSTVHHSGIMQLDRCHMTLKPLQRTLCVLLLTSFIIQMVVCYGPSRPIRGNFCLRQTSCCTGKRDRCTGCLGKCNPATLLYADEAQAGVCDPATFLPLHGGLSLS